MATNSMSFLLIISLVLQGCTYFLLSLKFTQKFVIFHKHSFPQLLKLLDQMVEVSTLLNLLNPFYVPMGLIIKFLVPILLNRMA